QLAAIVHADQRHALCRATHLTDFRYAGAHQHATVGDQHDLVCRHDQDCAHDLAVTLARLDGDHALGAAPMTRIFSDGGTLAETVLGGGQHALVLVFRHQHGNHALSFLQRHAAHTAGVAAHGAHIAFVEA